MSDLELLLKKRVDVVLLNSADPILEHQIRSHSKVLIDKNPKVRMTYELEARKKYFDFIYRHNNYMKILKNRIFAGITMTDKEITDRLISLISEYTADLKEVAGSYRRFSDFRTDKKNPALC